MWLFNSLEVLYELKFIDTALLAQQLAHTNKDIYIFLMRSARKSPTIHPWNL
uniref:Uncharacterized protein n=1 Tax=gamma proteobacterium D250 TaxID=649546 RepID=M4HWX4_9GAMM|nr:hypothetical protein [gamma proteobacterium D250]AFT64174.1 hypothetical protein [gamma proteobacterium D250]